MLAHFIYHSTIRNVALSNATLALFHDLFHKNVALLYYSLEKIQNAAKNALDCSKFLSMKDYPCDFRHFLQMVIFLY